MATSGPTPTANAITKADVAQSLAQLTVILEWYFTHERPAGEQAAAPVKTIGRGSPGSLSTPAGPGALAAPTKPPRRRIFVFAVPIALALCVLLALSAFLLPPVRAWLYSPVGQKDGRPPPEKLSPPDTPPEKSPSPPDTKKPDAPPVVGAADDDNKEGKVVTTDSGLKYEDLKQGEGDAAKAGDVVQVHYTGWLTTFGTTKGEKFDSGLDRGKPFEFKLGVGKVIKGWEEGVAGMKAGGKRLLVIPSELGYGKRGAGSDIPPNATLLFEVELLKIK